MKIEVFVLLTDDFELVSESPGWTKPGNDGKRPGMGNNELADVNIGSSVLLAEDLDLVRKTPVGCSPAVDSVPAVVECLDVRCLLELEENLPVAGLSETVGLLDVGCLLEVGDLLLCANAA
jgi:hypothetical protein